MDNTNWDVLGNTA